MALARRSAGSATAIKPAPDPQHISLWIGGVPCALEIPVVKQVRRMSYPVPTEIEHLGTEFPVTHLRSIFPAASEAESARHLVLVDSGRRTAAIGVNQLGTIFRLPANAVQPLPAVYTGPERLWCRGIAQSESGLFAVLALDALLEADDPQRELDPLPAMAIVE